MLSVVKFGFWMGVTVVAFPIALTKLTLSHVYKQHKGKNHVEG